MQMKEMLLALNSMSYQKGYTYVIQYNYQYSSINNSIYPNLLLLTYKHNDKHITKLTNKEHVKGEIEVIKKLAELIKSYT